jgi:hypothetical protein
LETIFEPKKGELTLAGAIAPNGHALALSIKTTAKTHADVWLVTAGGQRQKVAANGMVAAWSPDGTGLLCW